jgi:two-component system OmpR family sensor kinase
MAMATMMNAASVTDAAGRRLAVLRLGANGRVVSATPSGYADSPDPLPSLPDWSGGIPANVLGTIVELPSADGTVRYHVLIVQARMGAGILAIASPLTDVDGSVRALVRTLFIVGGLTISLVLLVAWLILRAGLLPIERIAATAQRIAGGDLSHRTGVTHDETEVGRMGAAFDAMLDQVEGAFTRQEAALTAKAASEDRLRRFVADASHELRTPVTSIRGYAELYRAGGLADRAALDTAMDRIGTESRRMGALVDDLLLLARLDQGRPLRQEPVNLSRICEDAAADHRAVDASRPLVAAIEPGLTMAGDDDRLRQVVGNLLANVRMHTPSGTPLELFLRRTGSMAELRVIDHGPGIPAEHAVRIFDRFYRADAGRAREGDRMGGSGLGLSIAASIVAAQAGRLWHEATPGGGATFVIDMPILTAASQATPGQS